MGMETEHMSLSQILNNFNQIIIPDIQRDYVMGSGGEKLTKLLNAMVESSEKKEGFDFSCLVGYKDDDNNLYIYDGQQRLATLVCLCSYLNKDAEIENLLKKFSFTKRDVANDWLSNPTKIKENLAVDFTTYSLVQLIEKFNTKQDMGNSVRFKFSDKITFDFLFEKVFFDMVLVNKISDAEQFFLDINDGLDLKSYEIYKAELYHHATGVLKESFKGFALKMENKWLNFFGDYKKIDSHSEEKILVFFLQYCFRMMWIEEKGSDVDFKLTNIGWLKKEHLNRVQDIIDAIINLLKDTFVPDVSCINYSYKKDSVSKGQHWNINDENYIAMLTVFLENIYNREEINKDVVIWCYISKLPFINQNRDELYKYLRYVKKILNNNRRVCNNAEIQFINWGVYSKEVIYARYCVVGVPQYYKCDKEKLDKNTLDLFNAIVVSNKRFLLDENQSFLDVYSMECKNDLLKKVLEKEQQKKDSLDKQDIEKYENLPFINGLVDNFLDYRDGICYLKEFCCNEFYAYIGTEEFAKDGSQYKDILRFIFKNQIDIDKTIFSDIYILWKNYCDTRHIIKGSLVPHTWCDLFTSEKGIPINESSANDFLNWLPGLPDGWIHEKRIFQPQDNDVNNTPRFASYSRTHAVWDVGNFTGNFSWVCNDELGGYIINGKKEKLLPEYLRDYDGENFITKNLDNTEKVFFSEENELNEILLYRLKALLENRGENADLYLKEKKDWMRFEKMNNMNFFIKLKEI